MPLNKNSQPNTIKYSAIWYAQSIRKLFLLYCLFIISISLSQSAIVRAQRSQTEKTASPQDQPLRLKTELMEVRAVVTDKQGNLIKNLNKDDFEITENNKSQTISFFSAENLRDASLLIDRDQPKRVDKNSAPSAKEVSRTVVIFIDTLHLSNVSFLRLKQTLLKFINEQLTDGDLAAVVTTIGNLGVFSQFTRNKEVLRKALDRVSNFPDMRSGSLYTPFLAASVDRGVPFALEAAMSIVRAEENLPNDPLFEPLVRDAAVSRAKQILSEATYRRRLTLLTLKTVAERLATMPGQRLMLTLSDGFTMLDSGGTVDSSDLQAAVSRAARSGVVIYSYLAKGLSPSSFYDVSNGRVGADAANAGRLVNFTSAGERELENGLSQIAKETGGEAFLTTNDLNGALEKTLNNNSFYYALSYYPAGDDKNTFRRVKVRVKNHPDYQVRTQTGYLAKDLKPETNSETSDPHKRLLQAINAPLVTTDIEVDATAEVATLQADGAQAILIVYTNGKRLKYVEVEKSFVTKLELMVEVVNAAGRSESITQDLIEIKLTAEGYKQAGQNIYRYNKNLQLKPGVYQIRLGVRDEHSDLIGTTSTWIEVPDLRSKKLFLSHLTLAKSSTNDAASSKEPKQAVMLPAVKRGISQFRSSDEMVIISRAYNALRAGKEASELKARVQVLQGTKIIFEDGWHSLPSMTITKDGETLIFGAQLKLQAFKPGTYELRMVVADEKLKNPIATSKLFEIEP
jgi:VWFA-related protein